MFMIPCIPRFYQQLSNEIQQLTVYLFTARSLYMFRMSSHTSSGIHKTVTTSSGTGHTVQIPHCRVANWATLEWGSCTVWPVPEAVVTVLCTWFPCVYSWVPCVYKQMLRRLPTFQVATTCCSCSPPDLNLHLSLTSFIFCLHVK